MRYIKPILGVGIEFKLVYQSGDPVTQQELKKIRNGTYILYRRKRKLELLSAWGMKEESNERSMRHWVLSTTDDRNESM